MDLTGVAVRTGKSGNFRLPLIQEKSGRRGISGQQTRSDAKHKKHGQGKLAVHQINWDLIYNLEFRPRR